MRGNWTSMAFSKGTPCTWQTHRHVMGEGWLGSPWSEMKALVRNFVYNPEKKHGLFRFSIRVKRWINCFTNVPHFVSLYCFHRSANACRLHCMLMKRQVSRFHGALPSAQVEAPRNFLFWAKYANLIQFRKLDCFHHWFQRSLKFHFSWEFSVQKPLRQVLKTSYPLMDSS